MITATKIFTFCASHSLPGHDGLCKNLHGHTYTLEVTVRPTNVTRARLVQEGSSEGMIIDFHDLTAIVRSRILDKLDHQYLNEVFDHKLRTTTEHLAIWMFNQLEGLTSCTIQAIKLWESPTSFVEVTPK